ncbi:MAG: hypothetical protein WBU92_03915 [Candidatus Dormiibacterota bacterium]
MNGPAAGGESSARPRHGRGTSQNGVFIPLPQNWRTCVLPLVGLATPVGLLLVNFSAWVISQLGAFRWGVAVSALVSALILNSLTGLSVYRYVRNRWPDFVVSRQENETWVLVGAIVVILAVAILSALFSYVGMANPKQLPNGIAVLTGFVGVVVPLALILGLNRRR